MVGVRGESEEWRRKERAHVGRDLMDASRENEAEASAEEGREEGRLGKYSHRSRNRLHPAPLRVLAEDLETGDLRAERQQRRGAQRGQRDITGREEHTGCRKRRVMTPRSVWPAEKK